MGNDTEKDPQSSDRTEKDKDPGAVPQEGTRPGFVPFDNSFFTPVEGGPAETPKESTPAAEGARKGTAVPGHEPERTPAAVPRETADGTAARDTGVKDAAPQPPAAPGEGPDESDGGKNVNHIFRLAFFGEPKREDLQPIVKPGLHLNGAVASQESVPPDAVRIAVFFPPGGNALVPVFSQSLAEAVKKTVKKHHDLALMVSDEIDYAELYDPYPAENIDFTFLWIDAVFKKCRLNRIDAIYFLVNEPVAISRRNIFFETVLAADVGKRFLYVDLALNLAMVKKERNK